MLNPNKIEDIARKHAVEAGIDPDKIEGLAKVVSKTLVEVLASDDYIDHVSRALDARSRRIARGYGR